MASAEELALEFVRDGSDIGLGTGRAATAFVRALGERVKAGLRVRGVPTSEATAKLAQGLGIPLTTLDEAPFLDVTVDGADEVDPNLDVIKGYGGAMVREKIVATAARKLVILVGPEKLVENLGQRGKLPVEVIPFGVATCRRRLDALGYPASVRETGGKPFVTDNGNLILDCAVNAIAEPAKLDADIRAIPGVLGTGLFLGMAAAVIVTSEEGATIRRRIALV
jgi:ribose 5-phosphate isomerase A